MAEEKKTLLEELDELLKNPPAYEIINNLVYYPAWAIKQVLDRHRS